MNTIIRTLAAALLLSGSALAESADAFLGRWALTIPGGGAGWLGVTQEDGYLDASILWGGGSVVPVSSVYIEGDALTVTRTNDVRRYDEDHKVVKTHSFTNTITATVDGETMSLTLHTPRENGLGATVREFTGNKIPDLPPAPDLSKLKYGEPLELLAENSLDGWSLLNANDANGWSVKDGVLSNNPVQKKGEPRIHYGNIRTDAEFEDFNLKLEVSVPKGNNSGIYLRGIYEVQVLDSYGNDLDSHNMGAIYSRITPSEAAEKPAGEWQSMDITLADRHVTVILNGTTIIDNQPLLGCTGGAMTSNEFKPGPLYLQGDHGEVQYRNIILRPIVN